MGWRDRKKNQSVKSDEDDVSDVDMLDLASVDDSSIGDSEDAESATTSHNFSLNDEFIPPDLEEAKAYRDENRPHTYIDGEYTLWPIKTNEADIGAQFGVGIALYFVFMRWMSLLWLLMFVLSIPTIGFGNVGTFQGLHDLALNNTGFNTFSMQLSTTTFASIADTVDSNYIEMTVPEKWYIQRQDLLTGATAMDVLATLLWLVSVFLMRRKMKKLLLDINADTISISDYTVQINGLPKDCSDSLEVQCFFEIKYGKVVDVVLCRNDRKLLNLFAKKTRCLHRAEREHARCLKYHRGETTLLKALTKQLNKLEQKVSQYQNKTYFETVAAYVTFSDASSALKCLQDCPTNAFSRAFMSPDKKFRGTWRYQVCLAPDPSDIVYENIGIKPRTRIFRNLLSWSLTLGIIAVSFAIIVVCRDFEQDTIEKTLFTWSGFDEPFGMDPYGTNPGLTATEAMDIRMREYKQGCTPILATCSEELSKMGSYAVLEYGKWADVMEVQVEGIAVGMVLKPDDVLNVMKDDYDIRNQTMTEDGKWAEQENKDLCLPCYCAGLATELTVEQKEKEYLVLQDQCSEFVRWDTTTILWRGAAILGILVTNKALEFFIAWTATIDKEESLSRKETGVAVKVMVATFANTAMLMLLVNADIDSVRKVLKGTLLEGWIFNGEHNDFNEGWYSSVGTAIIISMASGVAIPPVTSFILHATNKFTQTQAQIISLTQHELNTAYQGPEWQLEMRFGQMLMKMSVCMMFGSGMPILYLIASITFYLEFTYDRRHLLRLCRTPPRYSPALTWMTLKLMPWMAVLHLAVGIWMHSHFETERVDDFVDKACELTNTCAFFGSNSTMFSDMVGEVTDQVNDLTSKAGIDLVIGDIMPEKQPDTGPKVAELTGGTFDAYGRSMQLNTFPLTVLLQLLLFVIIVWKYLISGVILGALQHIFFCFKSNQSRNHDIKRLRSILGGPTFEDAFLEERIRGLPSYALKDNPKYRDAFYVPEVTSKVGDDEPDIEMEDMRRMLMSITGGKDGSGGYDTNPSGSQASFRHSRRSGASSFKGSGGAWAESPSVASSRGKSTIVSHPSTFKRR